MYYAENRMYDVRDKRFTQVDPVKDALNWYAYVGGNPVNRVDPLGLAYIVELIKDGNIIIIPGGSWTTNPIKEQVKTGEYKLIPQTVTDTSLLLAENSTVFATVAIVAKETKNNVVGGSSKSNNLDKSIAAVTGEIISRSNPLSELILNMDAANTAMSSTAICNIQYADRMGFGLIELARIKTTSRSIVELERLQNAMYDFLKSRTYDGDNYHKKFGGINYLMIMDLQLSEANSIQRKILIEEFKLLYQGEMTKDELNFYFNQYACRLQSAKIDFINYLKKEKVSFKFK